MYSCHDIKGDNNMSMNNSNKLSVRDLDLFYGEKQALIKINMDIKSNKVTALIGPSGCGKSTFLRTLNRMNDLIDDVKIKGIVKVDGEDIYKNNDVIKLRTKIGMVFQKPNLFPMSIYDNVAYGPRVHGIKDKKSLDKIVEESLKGAAIWDEVKDRLKSPALGLSGGQQQRVAVARAVIKNPAILLCDELTGALDYKSAIDVLSLVQEINRKFNTTILIITHNAAIGEMANRVYKFRSGEVKDSIINNNPIDARGVEW